jgi:hypothetical protein
MNLSERVILALDEGDSSLPIADAHKSTAERAMTDLQDYFASYRSTAEHNDIIWSTFGERADTVDFLKTHRDWVEHNSWGFGDRAFHYMWYLLLRDDVLERSSPSLLEIGVFKGQVVSLWALTAKRLGHPVEITGVSPLTGNQPWFANNRILRLCARLISRYYREDVRSANLYEHADYGAMVRRIFDEFGLQDSKLQLLKGYSQDEHIRQQLAGRSFDVIYIDGGHRYEDVFQDLTFYAPLVGSGGYLVMDDSSYYLPGKAFWKGVKSVSRALDDWGAHGFVNVLNVGHNRVYKRIP